MHTKGYKMINNELKKIEDFDIAIAKYKVKLIEAIQKCSS